MVVDFVLFRLQITQSNAQTQSKGSHLIGFYECQWKKFSDLFAFSIGMALYLFHKGAYTNKKKRNYDIIETEIKAHSEMLDLWYIDFYCVNRTETIFETYQHQI